MNKHVVLKNKNVLVTGGDGFIGSHLVKKLIKLGANIFVPQRSNNPQSFFNTEKLYKKVHLVHLDVKNKDRVFDVVTKHEIDFIFHLAAQPIVTTAFYNPVETLETNILGTINILEAARRYDQIKGIVIASSDKAYGKLKKDKYLESDPLKGDHPYEVSKSAADLIAQTYCRTYHLPIVITRFGNVYGEGDLNFSRIIPGIIKALITKETLEIRSDGKYIRDYIYVGDVVEGYLKIVQNMEKIQGEAFNFGSKETLSVLELIKKIEKTLKIKINYKILNCAQNEIPYQSLDYGKIKKTLGWEPKQTIAKKIESIYQWYISNT